MRAYLENYEQIKEGSTGRVTFKGVTGRVTFKGTNEAKRGEKSFRAKGTPSVKNTGNRDCEKGCAWPEPQK